MRFSNCEMMEEKRGNLINSKTEFNITGTLIKPIEVPFTDTLCGRRNVRNTLNVHVPFLSFSDAKKACDKFSLGSMVGPFEVSSLHCQNLISPILIGLKGFKSQRFPVCALGLESD